MGQPPHMPAKAAPRLPPRPKTRFELWQDTIDGSKTDPAWNSYDSTIAATVAAYNAHLAKARGFSAVDWKLIKAMVWTESGGPTTPAWRTRPLQIGNPGDPGLSDLLAPNKGGELVMPPAIRDTLTAEAVRTTPLANIQAGIGYLLMRAARFDTGSVEDAADTTRDYVVKPGDSFDRIGRQNGSTIAELQKLNPGMSVLSVGKTIKLRKASIRKSIIGFRALTTVAVAQLYSVGDPRYAEKLDYCLKVMP